MLMNGPSTLRAASSLALTVHEFIRKSNFTKRRFIKSHREIGFVS